MYDKDSVEILENGGPAIEVFNLANLTCFEGNDGKAKVEVTSGNGPYQYLWLLDSTNTDTISNLIAGIHKVRVTDNNGCSTMGQVNIYDPPRIYITLLYDPLQLIVQLMEMYIHKLKEELRNILINGQIAIHRDRIYTMYQLELTH